MRKTVRTLLTLGMTAMLLLQGCGSTKSADVPFTPKYDKDTDFSADELYSAIADIPDDRSFSDKETGLLDPAVRQFRAAIYAVGNGTMTVDEAIAAYGSIPEE
ncbi:MAG: hypothetical protein K6C96_05630 [Butyrivibrio sp.]|nr:hypothetical protein [Butyrivibrio sp.]